VVLIGLIVVALCLRVRLTIHISQAEIQQRLDAAFPVRKDYGSLMEVTIAAPTITLDPISNRIIADLAISGATAFTHHRLVGSATIAGSLRYDAASSSFYLDQARLQHVQIDEGGKAFTDRHGWLSTLLCRYLEERPIYVIQATSLPRSAARLVLKDVRIEAGSVVVTLGF
jgi:hypothetical protein